MLHLENFFEKSFALLLTTPRLQIQKKKWLTQLIVSGYNQYNMRFNRNSRVQNCREEI